MGRASPSCGISRGIQKTQALQYPSPVHKTQKVFKGMNLFKWSWNASRWNCKKLGKDHIGTELRGGKPSLGKMIKTVITGWKICGWFLMSKLGRPKMLFRALKFSMITGQKFGFGILTTKLPSKLLFLIFPQMLKLWNTFPSALTWLLPRQGNYGGKRMVWINGREVKFIPWLKWVDLFRSRGVGVSRPMCLKLADVLNLRTTIRSRFLLFL